MGSQEGLTLQEGASMSPGDKKGRGRRVEGGKERRGEGGRGRRGGGEGGREGGNGEEKGDMEIREVGTKTK